MNLELTKLAAMSGQQASAFPASTSPALGVQDFCVMLGIQTQVLTLIQKTLFPQFLGPFFLKIFLRQDLI